MTKFQYVISVNVRSYKNIFFKTFELSEAKTGESFFEWPAWSKGSTCTAPDCEVVVKHRGRLRQTFELSEAKSSESFLHGRLEVIDTIFVFFPYEILLNQN
ncbi:20676_t:CDS:2 [Funneliformis geosporum]|nr:20676_t:CDS:2 [Funneliformis geosporum]